MCLDCVRMARSPAWYCPQCMRSCQPGNRCNYGCGRGELQSLFAFGKHHHPLIRRALHRLKYGFIESIGVQLGRALGEAMLERQLPSVDALIPIPLSPRRLCKRDFNQAVRIAEGVYEQIPGALVRNDILQRIRHTKEQARLAREQRFANMADAFCVRAEPPRRVVLIDDVATTGATLQACAAALKRAGAQEISACVVAHG